MKRNITVAVTLAVIAGVIACVALRGKGKSRSAETAKKPPSPTRLGGGDPGAAPAPAKVRFEDDPVGSLRLEGQVLGVDGEPVGGAMVTISSNPIRTTRTEGDGSFAFDQLLPRPYRVSAHAGDRYAGPVPVRLTATSDPVVLRLQAGATLEVTVRDAEKGAPIDGAEVSLDEGAHRSAKADAAGIARLTGIGPGWYELHASAPGYGSVSRVVQLAGTAGAVEKQTVSLRRGRPVSGVVIGPSGKPVSGAKVIAESASASFLGSNTDETKSDDKGRWKIAALAPGSYRFRARHADHAPGTSSLITIDASSGRSGVEIRLGVGGRITGRVVNGDGKPVPAAAVRVASTIPSSIRRDSVRQAHCDDRGRFDITGLPRAALSLVALAEQGSSSVRQVDLSKRDVVDDLEIVLDRAGTISGMVVDGAGEPIAEARVEALPVDLMARASDWRLRGSITAIADQEGTFVLRGVGKGKLHIRARRPGRSAMAPLFTGISSNSVVAKAGDRDVKVVLQKEGTIVGRVAFENGQVPDAFGVSVGWAPPRPFSGTQGKFRLTGVTPGKHRLRVTGPGILANDEKQVEVKPGAEVDVGTIQVHKGRSLRGRVLDPSGVPIAGAEVSAGGFLIGDGTSFSNQMMGGMVKVATSGADGSYVLYGVGERDLVIVADHQTAGRSAMMTVPGGKDDSSIDLRLLATGAVQGKVTRGGKPVPAMVTAKVEGMLRGQLMVQTGPDGTFRFDRLAPGSYGFHAKKMGGMLVVEATTGGPEHMATAKVTSGNTATVSITIPEGPTLQVDVVGVDGKKAPNAAISLLRGKVTLAAGKDLSEVRGARQAVVMESHGMRIPAVFENVEPGDYTVCGTPLPSMEQLTGAGGSVEVSIDSTKIQPVCKHMSVKPAPEKQRFELALPPYAPGK